ncbi:ArsR/SmtB family transcription factor [Winogradskya humida]|uniref:Transcriptional regulator n=1 Tax=Winogradskya humida TaxID=113566 RepID=A0ABQ3ZZ91_9ACTN|nr:helix-turn-helix domain-containing protein [Actinoplanes humidus]GIE23930.1 transcriptional regulator [Actinoplanes humidus]
MLTFELTAAEVRFAHSPMAETMASLVALQETDRFWMYASWRARVTPALAALGLRTLPAVVAHPHVWLPDFLTPVPAIGHPRPRLRDELAQIAATPLDLVAYEMDLAWKGSEPPPEISMFATDPARGLALLVRDIRQYFEVAVAPLWPRLRAAAEGEMRTRTGPAMLHELHPTVRWDGSVLALQSHKATETYAGQAMTLLPSAFAGPKVFALTSSPRGSALWYPPRGFGTLWNAPGPVPGAAVSALLGATRAAVLTLVAAPHSTGEVAAALGISAATASHHLTTLRDAGLVVGNRDGRQVRYARTDLGDQVCGDA